jgi:hypothetical protein
MRDLPLPVGHRRGNAVLENLQSTHAERRARTEAADRQLHVLGVVLAIVRRHAGHALEHFGHAALRARRHVGDVDAIDRRGRAIERALSDDDDAGQRRSASGLVGACGHRQPPCQPRTGHVPPSGKCRLRHAGHEWGKPANDAHSAVSAA